MVMASIMSGKYKPGERLPSERDLAAAFKVSRPTIREAMISLEIRGLAEVTSWVRHLRHRQATQPGGWWRSRYRCIRTYRGSLGCSRGEAAALAATTIGDDRLEELERIVAEMVDENARKQQDWTADRRFSRCHRSRHAEHRHRDGDREPCWTCGTNRRCVSTCWSAPGGSVCSHA